jgi:uncharacterized protein
MGEGLGCPRWSPCSSAWTRWLPSAAPATAPLTIAVALLHELFNYPKDHPESSRSGEVSAEHAAQVMLAEGCDPSFVERVAYAIRVHPFLRGIVPETLEGKVLQDADRLDSIGALGIARCFASCAEMQRPFFDPDDPFCRHRKPDDKRWGVDHFYRKLLHIPEVLHTAAARKIAEGRVAFMQTYLDQLEREVHRRHVGHR